MLTNRRQSYRWFYTDLTTNSAHMPARICPTTRPSKQYVYIHQHQSSTTLLILQAALPDQVHILHSPLHQQYHAFPHSSTFLPLLLPKNKRIRFLFHSILSKPGHISLKACLSNRAATSSEGRCCGTSSIYNIRTPHRAA